MWSHVLRLGKITGARIERRVEIVDLNPDPVRYAVVAVAVVVVGVGRERSGKRIDPGTRPDAELVGVQAGRIWVGAARAQLNALAATTGITPKPAGVVFQCSKRMLHPRLANLFKAFGVITTAAHPVEVLRNDRVICVGQCEPIDRLGAVITGSGCHSKTDLRPEAAEFFHVWQITDNHIRP